MREILRNFNQNLLQIQTWETKKKTGSRLVREHWETAFRDLSQEREARDTALAKQVAEAIARENGKGSHTLPGLTQ